MRTRGPIPQHRSALLGAGLALLAAGALPATSHAQRQLSSAPVVGARALAPSLRLQASLAERALYVWAGDSLLRMYPVAVGKSDYPTPRGSFTIERVIWNPSWVPPESKWARGKQKKGPTDADNPMQAVKLFFREPDYYIHGTNKVETLGTAASHGCLRMSPEDAAELALLIMEHGGEPRDTEWLHEVLRDKTTRTVRLPLSVTMSVE